MKINVYLRKLISKYKCNLMKISIDNYHGRQKIHKLICQYEDILKMQKKVCSGGLLPGTSIEVSDNEELPNFGKFKDIIEKKYKEELNIQSNSANISYNDIKRLALKKVFMDYFNSLNYNYDTPIVSYVGDMTLRRDDEDVDNTDFDFAPNKNKIYAMWMEELGRYVRNNMLNKEEFDESANKGAPQGGAFEKLLDRYRQEVMKEVWKDFRY